MITYHLLQFILTFASSLVFVDADMPQLQISDRNRLPQIIYPTDPLFDELRKAYIVAAAPPAIARPRNAAEVSEIIRYVTEQEHNISFTIRGGGHELYARSVVSDALTIDLRLIDSVEVIDNGKHARVGGGCSHKQFATALAKEGYVTPFSTVVDVGMGWSMVGGYSLFANHYGLGIDQIVGAKVVNWKGDIVEADADMLFGIRGAQGNFGVVVELTLKIHRIETPSKKILAGTILYESSVIGTLLRDFFHGFEALEHQGLPLELGIEPFVLNIPQLGRVFGVFVVSSGSDLEAVRPWIDKVKALGTVVNDTVAELDIPASTVPSCSSDNMRDILARNIEQMTTDPATLFYAHRLRGPSAAPDPTSCFALRETHWMLELIGNVVDETGLAVAQAWIKKFYEEVEASGETSSATYVAVTRPGDNPTKNIYGANWDRLLDVKRKYDPYNIFKRAVPPLPEAYA